MINPGDEVILPAPYWVSYPDMVLFAEGNPVTVECSEKDGFKLKPDVLEKAITAKTIINRNNCLITTKIGLNQFLTGNCF